MGRSRGLAGGAGELRLALTRSEFEQVVAEHGPALYRLAFRWMGDVQEAEDIVQDTFRSVWKSREQFQPERGERAWLTAILRRRVADAYRRRPIRYVLAGDQTPEVQVLGYDVAAQEYSDEVQQALEQLAPELRETLLLVIVGELTHQEAADLLHVPVGTVLSRVSRARAKLREYLSASAAKSRGP